MEKRALEALLCDHADNAVVRIRSASDDDVSAIVTVGELTEAISDEAERHEQIAEEIEEAESSLAR